jgi:hypothetical protein
VTKAERRPRWKTALFAAGLAAIMSAAIAVAMLALEAGVRLNRGVLFSSGQDGDAAAAPARAITRTSIAAYDPLLGHIPTPNLVGFRNYDANVTTDAEGLRLNGPGPRPPGRSVLAIGDSFTFGLEVDDDASWPARLEGLLGRPVINAGVFGYGIDQIVLRGEQLVEAHKDVDLVVLAVFGGDIERSEYSYLFATKPYFDIRNGALELQNVPVPDVSRPVRLAALRTALRPSHLADALLSRLAPQWWLVQGRERREHDRGDEVASLLLERWGRFTRARNLRTLYVALVAWPANVARLRALTSAATRQGMEVLDLSEPLWTMIQADKSRWQEEAGHLTREGNAWVAAQIAARLKTLPAQQG